MSGPVAPLKDFADLRRVGISYAQAASGEIWSDYNLHDPGVTLLEQTCFALSQIAYQAELPIRDLLTNDENAFDRAGSVAYARHAEPRTVLASAPVTRGDLAAWLCDRPEIDSVDIAPPDPARPGLYDITVVPSELGERHPDPEAAFRALFAEVRPLCTALGQVRRAHPVDVTLRGKIEIGSETLPEYAAAALWLEVSRILSGSHQVSEPATRADVWTAPERMLAPAQMRLSATPDLSRYLARLRELPGISDIETLSVVPLQETAAADVRPRYLRLPRPREDKDIIGLQLTLDGAPVTLSAARMLEEYVRLSAEGIARAAHHIDAIDWDVLKPGRHRRFRHAHVDALLPELYRVPYPSHADFDAGALFASYREAIDGQLRDMVDTLSRVPDTFVVADGSDNGDPLRHRLRIMLLDYLIALQGCEMPATRHSGLHRYMMTSERHRFEVSWRLEYLRALPALHLARGRGPGPGTPGGFLAELAILCDLGVSADGRLGQPLSALGLALDETARLVAETPAEAPQFGPVTDPFDMLVPEADGDEVLAGDALRTLSPFLDGGRISSRLLARLADRDAFFIAPQGGDDWLVLFDPGGGDTLRRVAVTGDRQSARETVRRLRATWRHLNLACEAAHLVEHLPAEGAGFAAPNTADLVLPGFTARCAMPSYRSYVAARVLALAPAHVHVRLHWLDAAELDRYADLVAAADRAPDALLAFLEGRAAREAE